MDGMCAGFAGTKTDHSFTALARHFTLPPFLPSLSSVPFYLVPGFAGVKRMRVFTYWCKHTMTMLFLFMVAHP